MQVAPTSDADWSRLKLLLVCLGSVALISQGVQLGIERDWGRSPRTPFPKPARSSGQSCASTPACSVMGACEGFAPDCYAASDATCRSSELCRRSAECFVRNFECRVREEADCRASEDCRVFGLCSLGAQHCVAASEVDCRAALICTVQGECTLSGNRCIADTETDCKASLWCKLYDRCWLDSWSRSCSYPDDPDLRTNPRPAMSPQVDLSRVQ